MEHMSSVLEHSAVQIAINRNCEVTNSEEGVRGRERERREEGRKRGGMYGGRRSVWSKGREGEREGGRENTDSK